jgi:hypothetical protein
MCLLCKVREVMRALREGPEECRNTMSIHQGVDCYRRANSICSSEGGLWLLERVDRKHKTCRRLLVVMRLECSCGKLKHQLLAFVTGAEQTVLRTTRHVLPSRVKLSTTTTTTTTITTTTLS